MRKKSLVSSLMVLGLFVMAQVSGAQSQAPPAPAAGVEKKAGVPEDPKKHTSLGLYVSAKEAYEMWQKDKANIKIVDCRTPEEYVFVGHAPMARNVPGHFVTYQYDTEKKDYRLKENPRFVKEIKSFYQPTDTLLLMCRSGHRAAACIERLAKAGFTRVYNIHDGFEGDKVTDKKDPNYGKRTKNGWKNSGIPWTYDLDPELMYLPKGTKR